MNTKPSPQMTPEQFLENNAYASALLERARDRAVAEANELGRILSELPPRSSSTPSRLVNAFATSMTALPAPPTLPKAEPISPEHRVIYAAMAMVQSWKGRHKKNWQLQERELASAIEGIVWNK